MIQKWVLSIVVAFVMRQIAKFTMGIDWVLIKLDIEARVRDIVPGVWLDDQAVKLALTLIDIVASVLSAQEDLQKIVDLMIAGKTMEAWEVLKAMILDGFVPQTTEQKTVVECIGCM